MQGMSRNTLRGTVTSKGQITIPKPLRDRLGIRAGEVLEFEEHSAGEIVARKTSGASVVDAAYGLLTIGSSTDAVVESLRGRPDAL